MHSFSLHVTAWQCKGGVAGESLKNSEKKMTNKIEIRSSIQFIQTDDLCTRSPPLHCLRTSLHADVTVNGSIHGDRSPPKGKSQSCTVFFTRNSSVQSVCRFLGQSQSDSQRHPRQISGQSPTLPWSCTGTFTFLENPGVSWDILITTVRSGIWSHTCCCVCWEVGKS